MNQQTIDMWNSATSSQTPQEFMNISRQKGFTSIEDAVDAYVEEMPGMFAGTDSENWARENADGITGAMVTYLTETRGVEWDIAQPMSLADALRESEFLTACADNVLTEVIVSADGTDGSYTAEEYDSMGNCRRTFDARPLEEIERAYHGRNWWPMREAGEWGDAAEAAHNA
ncbi:MAG TPA: hypothetical protein VFN78_03810 [Ktedonobacterales bacterium]|nr:hypothetical protein [Ktedonobacterales bacterium]